MQGNKIKKYLTFTGLGLFSAAAIALPIVAVQNSLKNSSSFDFNKIGVYVEKPWMPAYELAVKKYNEKFSDRKFDIQLLELGAFDAVDLIQKLGYGDQKVADLIYSPIDRVPTLVEHHGALMGFDSPEKIISDEFDKIIYQGSDVKTFAKKGEALITPPGAEEGTEPKPYYFGIPHSTEALILYYKGFSDEDVKSIDSIVKSVQDDQWTNSMYSFKFNDLWYALGLIAGFLESKQTGAGTNGQLVGKVLVSANTLASKFQSNMAHVEKTNAEFPLQEYQQTPGWTSSGVSITSSKATEALQEALDFLAHYYNSSKVENKILGQQGNDWLLDGDQYEPKTTILSEKATKAAVINGPWMVSNYSSIYDHAIPVPNIEENIPYIQAPGGWLYGINQRNAQNPDKIRDMKRFLNILLTDKDVIMSQYQNAGKIIEGSFAKTTLQNYAQDTSTPKLEAAVIKAVYDSKTMDQRPDGGNADFNSVWSKWDENGFRAAANKEFLVGMNTQDLSDDKVSEKLKAALATSFTTMLKSLRDK